MYCIADTCEMVSGLCLNGKCINLPGGYRCMCTVGYKLTMDAKRCLGEKLTRVCYKFVHENGNSRKSLQLPTFVTL